MNRQQIFSKIAACILPLVLFCSCNSLFENLEECDYTLRFRYDYNMENKDWFADQVNQVQVFVFDSQGKFVNSFSGQGDDLKKSGYQMTIPHQLKGHKMVIWAGKTDPYYTLPALKTGDPMETLTLSYLPNGNISSSTLEPLWHCGPATMTFEEENGTTQTASLIRTTNDVRVNIQTREGNFVNSDLFNIQITGANNAYDCHHAFLSSCKEIAYMPSPANSDQTTACICCMRFIRGDKLLFSVTEKSSGKPISIGGETQINLIDYLLKSKPDNMSEQEYLDRRYIWEISISYDAQSYVALKIIVNGWTHWFQPVDI